jgi:signal transduction histidine kinase
MNLSFISALIVSPITAAIAFFAYVRHKSDLTRYFAIANGALAVWNCPQFVVQLPMPHFGALWFYRLSFIAGVLIVPSFFQFIFAFMGKNLADVKVIWNGVRIGAVSLSLACFSPAIIRDVFINVDMTVTEIKGPLFPCFMVYFLAPLGYALYLLFRSYPSARGHFRMQYRYMLLALAVAFIEALSYFYSTIYLHAATYYYHLQIVYVLLISYAIVAHRLMDITVIIRKTVVYSLITGITAAIMVSFAAFSVRVSGESIGESTILGLILATALISAIVHPLQLRIQAVVDKHFFRGWADREIVREVAAGFSHELKSPLAGLSMQAQLALQEIQDAEEGRVAAAEVLPKIKEALRYLVSQSSDAARRIEAVRGVAEPAEGQIEPVDIPAVIDNSLAYLERVVHETRVTIRREMPKRIPAVRSNAKQLEIVFINLIKNALQAMGESETNSAGRGDGGILALSAGDRDGLVSISVKDTGPGIAAKDIPHIFEPYFSTKGRHGTGMGLYLTHQIVKAHGGTIDVQSDEGKGTEFIVRLPRYADRQAKVEAA